MFTRLQDYVAERIYQLDKQLDETVIYYYSLHLRRLNIFSEKFAEKSNGAVAQLGERIPRTDEAVGSIPICSTIFYMRVRVLMAGFGCGLYC